MGWLDFFFGNRNAVKFPQKRQQQAFIESYEFPSGVRAKFARRHPQLSAAECERVFAALRQYFLICHDAGQSMITMPSRVVDDAWHEFILFTREYHEFCQQAFGRYYHHTPAPAMANPRQESTGRQLAWRLACKREGLNPMAALACPLLFAIDSQLGIANGFFYTPEMMTEKRPDSGGAGGCGGGGGNSGDGGSNSSGCADGSSGDGGSGCGDGGSGCGGGGSGCGGGGCGGGCGGG